MSHDTRAAGTQAPGATHGTGPGADADPAADRADRRAPAAADERLRRWRLVLGGANGRTAPGCTLSGTDAAMDRTLQALYGGGAAAVRAAQRRGEAHAPAGSGGSAPQVARWLGDIRTYFPSSVVQVMQRDAIERLGLSALLLEPEMLEAVEPDVHLVGTLLSLNKAMPETSKETARAVVRKVVEELERRLASRTRSTLTGALDRSAKVQPPPPPRHRLEPHHPRQPQELPARAPHGRPGAADRLRAGGAGGAEGRHPLHRPVRLDGGVRGLRVGLRRGARLDAVARRPGSSSSTPASSTSPTISTTPSTCCSARSSAAAPTSTGRSPTARRDQPPRRDHLRAHQRPLRGRHPRRDAQAGRRR